MRASRCFALKVLVLHRPHQASKIQQLIVDALGHDLDISSLKSMPNLLVGKSMFMSKHCDVEIAISSWQILNLKFFGKTPTLGSRIINIIRYTLKMHLSLIKTC